MTLDPIQEIREIRAQILREFNGDMDAYSEYLEKKYRNSGLNFVEPKPKPSKRAAQKPKKLAGPSIKKKSTTKPSNRSPKRKKSA